MEQKQKNYPRWVYHATQEPTLVTTPEHEAKLGSGWGETPVEKPEKAQEKPTAKAKASKGSADA